VGLQRGGNARAAKHTKKANYLRQLLGRKKGNYLGQGWGGKRGQGLEGWVWKRSRRGGGGLAEGDIQELESDWRETDD